VRTGGRLPGEPVPVPDPDPDPGLGDSPAPAGAPGAARRTDMALLAVRRP
jgi:hypothetical protein